MFRVLGTLAFLIRAVAFLIRAVAFLVRAVAFLVRAVALFPARRNQHVPLCGVVGSMRLPVYPE